MASQLNPIYRQMLLFVALVPAVIVATDHPLLLKCSRFPDKEWIWLTGYWFALQTAAVAYYVGRQLQHSRWWWGILAWMVLLVDIQLFSILGPLNVWRNPAKSLGFAFVSAQAGVAVMWGLLGSTDWRIRIPVVVGAYLWALGLGTVMDLDESLLMLLIAQTIATTVFCLVIRRRGFRMTTTVGADELALSGRASRPTQFSIRHLFIWMTSVACLVGVGRWLDFNYLLYGILSVSLIALLAWTIALTSVSMTAAWAALGREHGLIRLLIAVTLLPLIGVGLASWHRPFEFFTGYWRETVQERLFAGALWSSLAGLFLLALLLAFRARGDRLQRPA